MDDELLILAEEGRAFSLWTSFDLINSMVRSCESSFEVGDDGSWNDLSELMKLGTKFTVALNGKLRMTGRVELLNSPLSADQSSVVRFVVRTRLADLETEAAEISVRVKDQSIRDVVLAVLSYAGIEASEVVFRADVSRELITGRRGKGKAPPKDLEELKVQAAAVQPGESVKMFLDRHLRRHGLIIFDSADGKLVVASVDDDQEETYFFRCFRNDPQFNNFTMIDRNRDATGAPSEITVYGFGGGAQFQNTKLVSIRENAEIKEAGFFRRQIIVDDGIKTKELAERTAARALSERIRRQDAITIQTDGLSYRERRVRVPYAPDTTCGVIADTIGGVQGKFYVETTACRVNARGGATTQLQLVKSGTWSL
jgi:prophage tail gpP-like protein